VWFRRHTKITKGEATLQPGFVVLHSPHGMAGRTQDQSGKSGSQLEYRLLALWANGVVIFR
jgi:hypothetical protein